MVDESFVSKMTQATPDDHRLMQYLLGNLDEDQSAEIEDRAFTAPEFLAEIQAAEAELIDSYVRGGLTQPDRRRFEYMFLTSPQRRSKIEFARALARLADEHVRQVPPVRPVSAWRSFQTSIAAWRSAPQLAAGLAVIAVAAGLAWLAANNRAMRSHVAELESERTNLAQQSESLRGQLAEERGRTRAPVKPVPAPIASLILFPGVSRGAPQPVSFVVDSAAQLARLEVHLDSRDDFQRFRAALSRGGSEILTRSGLRRQQTAAGMVVTLEVPVSVLPAGSFELALQGLRDGEPPKDIGFYYFAVKR